MPTDNNRVVPFQAPIEVHQNNSGDVVIWTTDDRLDETFIVIPQAYVGAVVNRLASLIDAPQVEEVEVSR